jgi:hypothetical protein
MTDVGAVDLELVRYRSPAKMRNFAVSGEEGLITPDRSIRNKLRSNYSDTGRLEKYHISEESELKELKGLVEKGIRATVLDFNAAGEERVPENMGFAADSSSCNAKTLCASLNETLKLADIPDPVEEIEDSEEVRLKVIKAASARVMDRLTLEKTGKTGCAKSWAAAVVNAAYSDQRFRPADVVAALTQRGHWVFEDERGISDENRRLLTMRLQRAMAERMKAAPRRSLIKGLVQKLRDGMEQDPQREVTSPEMFEKVVCQFEELGEGELRLRAKEAAEEERANQRNLTAGLMTAGDTTSNGEETQSKRRRVGGAMTEGETEEESEVEATVVSRPPARSVWQGWSAAEVFAHYANSTGLEETLTLKDQEEWQISGEILAQCASGAEVAKNCKLEGEKRERVAQVFNSFFTTRGARFGSMTENSDGSQGKELKQPAPTTDTKYGAVGGELFSAKQVAKNPEYRKFWHGAYVLWLDNGDEQIGQITNSKNTTSVKFNIAPANAEAETQWWTVEQAAQGMESYNQFVRSQRAAGKEVNVFELLTGVVNESSRRAGPKAAFKKEKRKIEDVLDDAASRLAEGCSRPLSFSADGIPSGEDLRVLLVAINMGGGEIKKVVNSDVGQRIITRARDTLRKHGSAPSDIEIIQSVFGSRALTSPACFNVCKGEDAGVPRMEQTIVLEEGGDVRVKDVHKDNRKSSKIMTIAQSNFALRRWLECLDVAHGATLAAKWYLEMLKMQDDIMIKNVSSDVGKPVREIWTATWAELPGKLSEAARVTQRVQAQGQEAHAGKMAGEVSVTLEDWKNKREEIVMLARLEWMQQMQASMENKGGRGQKVKRSGSRFHEDEMPVGRNKKRTKSDDGGNAKINATLRKVGFDTLEEAKDDFLKDKQNKSKCFWACSKAGVALGGCQFPDCTFIDSHPGRKKRNG